MKKLMVLLLLASSLILTSCGGGGGSTSTGGVKYTHQQLANEFVTRLYTDLGIDVSLVKVNTFKYDYIVVYDDDLFTYDAYYIGDYNVGEDLENYLYNYDSNFYYDLFEVPGIVNVYEDWSTGIQFEETSNATKDLEKVGALMQNLKDKKVADKLVNFGLSQERATKVARLASQWDKVSKTRSMTDADANPFISEVTGSSIEILKKAQRASLEGDNTLKEDLILQATEHNEAASPEGIRDLMNTFLK